MPFREDLQCDVIRLEYDFERRHGHLFMQEGNCCDMDGGIVLFEAIDARVKHIETHAGKKQDTSYMNDSAGKWHSIPSVPS